MTSHINIILEIRKILAPLDARGSLSAAELARELEQPLPLVRIALSRMVGESFLTSTRVLGELKYSRTSPFLARRIFPLSSGASGWIVETFDGQLVCWCYREFDARIIADALTRS